MDVVALIGRILFAALFIGGGFAHLTQAEAMGGYAASKGVPQAKLATLVSRVLIIVGGLAGAALLILGLYAGYGADLGITITGPLF